ncbi:hypothetical protein [uncultured Phycicoccus sp.]|uniref:hypothetical protein n=1 Tax=uncultured Phycicoccus sp. TaxID=661422 RepID=UPI0026194D1D|nr:hypothetical protein [uncultured Phycicoccus sp.]
MRITVTEDDYLFLMRHAAHLEGHLTLEGSERVRQVASRWGEWVASEWRHETDRRIRLWCTSAAVPEVQETLDLLTLGVSETLERSGGTPSGRFAVHPEPEADASHPPPLGSRRQRWMGRPLPDHATACLDPALALTAYSPSQEAFTRLRCWLDSSSTGDTEARGARKDAPLLVGNDPLIGYLASALVGQPVPVARGELVCLVRAGKRWRLLWTISDDGPDEEEAVRAKIKSKMNTAAGLGTVIVGLTTFLLQNALQQQPTLFQWLAFAALGTSAGLYFAALFLYDSLQMPVRFWGARFETRTAVRHRGGIRIPSRLRHGKVLVRRPPSSSARLLQSSMLRVWTWIFTPACVLGGVGVAFYALGATPSGTGVAVEVELSHVLVAMFVLAASVSAWVAWHRPNLGASD